MNTTTQRPTPETDDAARKGAYLTHGKYPETCGKQIVHIDFARKLERERDEAQERAESKHGLWMAELSRVTGLEKQLEAMRKERDEAKEELENWKASGIHSCHDECKRPLCVANRKIKAMREAIKEAWIEIQYAEAGFAGLALRVCPNDSAVESVLNRMTEALAKLQPFLK